MVEILEYIAIPVVVIGTIIELGKYFKLLDKDGPTVFVDGSACTKSSYSAVSSGPACVGKRERGME